MSCICIAIGALAVVVPAAAQNFTQPSTPVGRGAVQIETSTVVSGDPAGRAVTGPGPLVRLGITDRLELQAGSPGFLHGFGEGGVTGAADPVAALLWRLTGETVFRPEVAVIGSLSLPFGSPELTSTGYDPGITLTWTKQLPRGFDAAGNFSAGSVTADAGRVLAHSQSLAVGHTVLRAVRGYLELYRLAPAGTGPAAAWVASAGVTTDIAKDRGIDVEFGRTFAGAARSWSVIATFAMRLPFRVR